MFIRFACYHYGLDITSFFPEQILCGVLRLFVLAYFWGEGIYCGFIGAGDTIQEKISVTLNR